MFSKGRAEAVAKREKQLLDENRLDIVTVKPGDALHRPKRGDSCAIHYTVALEDGKVFDSSQTRGQPLLFRLGASHVVPGLEETILKMSKGQKCVVKVPHDLAYGENGYPPTIPPYSTVTFEVELISFSSETSIVTDPVEDL